MLKASRVISKKYKKIRANKKNDQLQFLKQVPMHPRDRLAGKIKNIDNDVKFIKQVPLHPQDRLACKTRDMYDDMETS